jgi:hypothetical protein
LQEPTWTRTSSDYLGPCAVISIGKHKGGKLLVQQLQTTNHSAE